MDTHASILAFVDLGLTWNIVQFIIGLGVMVFVHELGHFLAAKAVGIKVERFALGFGPRVLGFKPGETDYCINALPLGGYIKMLGQEDFAPLKDEEEVDPRSYNAKTVGQRMLVIAAGVIMNAITALIMFTIIGMIGHEFRAPILGEVGPHSPAAEAKVTWVAGPEGAAEPNAPVGLASGDRVTRIEGPGVMLAVLGSDVERFDSIQMTSAMSGRGDRFKLTFERKVDGNTWTGQADLGVRMDDGILRFGISPAMSTIVRRMEAVGLVDGEVIRSKRDPFLDQDRVVSVAGRKTEYSWHVEEALAGANGLSVPVRVVREGKEISVTAPRTMRQKGNIVYLPDGTKLDMDEYETKEDEGKVTFTPRDKGNTIKVAEDDLRFVAAEQLVEVLGMTPRLAIGGVLRDTPAEKAGLRPDDVIVHYGDTPLPRYKQIRETSKAAVDAGMKGLTLVVERDGNQMAPLTITPEKEGDSAALGFLSAPDLGHTVVAYVRPNSAADRAGIESGSVIEKVNGQEVRDWAEIFEAVRAGAGKEIALSLRRSTRPDAETVEAAISPQDSATFDPNDYQYSPFLAAEGFAEPEMTTIRQNNIGDAFLWSLQEAGTWTISTYISIRSLVVGTVSTKQFVGPLGMGAIAVKAAEHSFMTFFHFMAIISTILAVMNFLPLPVVDGGHAVFLIIEKIRGKPLPVKVLNFVQLAGLILLGLVFLALTWQDLTRMFF